MLYKDCLLLSILMIVVVTILKTWCNTMLIYVLTWQNAYQMVPSTTKNNVTISIRATLATVNIDTVVLILTTDRPDRRLPTVLDISFIFFFSFTWALAIVRSSWCSYAYSSTWQLKSWLTFSLETKRGIAAMLSQPADQSNQLVSAYMVMMSSNDMSVINLSTSDMSDVSYTSVPTLIRQKTVNLR